MKKYRLLKDLPNLKIGAIFETHKNETHKAVDNKGYEVFYGDQVIIDNPEWFEPVEEKKVGEFWKPRAKADYFFIDALGVEARPNLNLSVDEKLIDIGNCFKTWEEAQKFGDYIKAVRKLQQVVKDSNEGKTHQYWSCTYVGHYVDYIVGNTIMIVSNKFPRSDSLMPWYCFKDKEDAKYSLKEHKDLWITFHTGLK